MELSDLALRVVLLFFPGVIAALIVDALVNHRDRGPFAFGTRSMVLGLLSYLLLASARALANGVAHRSLPSGGLPELIFFRALTDERVKLDWVGRSCIAGDLIDHGSGHESQMASQNCQKPWSFTENWRAGYVVATLQLGRDRVGQCAGYQSRSSL
jgi:hypothetical protein